MSAAAQNRLAAIPSQSPRPNTNIPVTGDVGMVKNLKKGYLFKLGEHHKSWKMRFFVLEGDKLHYYKTAENSKPISFIHLQEAIVRVSYATDKEFTFEVITTNRLYFLSASSYEEMYEWIQCLARKTTHHRENEKFSEANEMIQNYTYKEAQSLYTEHLKEYEKHAPMIREQLYLAMLGDSEEAEQPDSEDD